jgi:hypothetical protein
MMEWIVDLFPAIQDRECGRERRIRLKERVPKDEKGRGNELRKWERTITRTRAGSWEKREKQQGRGK